MIRHLLVSIQSILKNLLPTRLTSLRFSAIHFNFSALNKLMVIVAILVVTTAYGQDINNQQQQDYLKVIKTRSEKIVNVLGITDSHKYNTVLNELIRQYSCVNSIHEKNSEAVAKIKQQTLSKEEADEAVKKQEAEKKEKLEQRHARFIAQLKMSLTEEQVDHVKDGMTYKVFPITYAGYLDMLPSLTEEQRNQIYTWLKEARELAIDAESSEKKHAVFGKYKGKINNYLSKAGYDMNKESKAWQERIKERQKNK